MLLRRMVSAKPSIRGSATRGFYTGQGNSSMLKEDRTDGELIVHSFRNGCH
jgi:hypothetical protein